MQFLNDFHAHASPADKQIYAAMRDHAQQADAVCDIPDGVFDRLDVRRLNDPERGTQSVLSRCEWLEVMAHADAALTVALPGPSLSQTVIDRLGRPDQRARFLDCFATDTPVWGAFALTETTVGSDATRLMTTATECNGGFVLNGCKRFIGNGGRARYVVVFATVDPAKGQFGIRAFYVPLPASGVRIDDRPTITGMRAVRPSQITFTDCFVDRENLIGVDGPMELSRSFSLVQLSFDSMRPCLTSLMIGASVGLLDQVRDQADGQAGRTGQRLRMIADGYRGPLSSARGLARRAAAAFDAGHGNSILASICKSNAQRVACALVADLRRVRGLRGSPLAATIDRYWRDFQAFRVMEGTADVHDLMIARARLAQSRPAAPVPAMAG